MAKPPSLLESLAQMARHKHEAARARRMADHGAEKPREIILTACSAIADQLSKDGFSFLKSGPKLKRKARDLTYNIHFQSDRNNVAGRRAAMWIHASVSSDIMARRRLENPMPWNGTHKPSLAIITGGQIGNLLPNSSWMEWNFADISRRAAQIDEATTAIRTIMLPFFALFETPATAVETLIHYPALWQSSLIEYALAHVGRDAAQHAMRQYLTANPRIHARYDEALTYIRLHGPITHRGDTGAELAMIANIHAFNLTDI